MQVELVASCPDLTARPEPPLPEFAFMGRSNCGKSSLINYVLGRRNLARTSGQPGKTRLLHYYRVADRYYVVDMPGYGYARVSKHQRAGWQKLFHAYLEDRERPRALFHLLDVRHRPSRDDVEIAGAVRRSGHPFGVVITKIDKVGTTRRPARYGQIIDDLLLPADTPFFPTSAEARTGRKEMLGWMQELLAAAET
ncbi:MAG: ribosome biogenesis GTP-binding protein YihA/YsxC [Candidatus Krumholzibacteriia bacterium]